MKSIKITPGQVSQAKEARGGPIGGRAAAAAARPSGAKLRAQKTKYGVFNSPRVRKGRASKNPGGWLGSGENAKNGIFANSFSVPGKF